MKLRWCLLLLSSVTIAVGQQNVQPGPTPVCPDGWTKSDKNCYKLGNTTAKSVVDAELECKSQFPPGARLPVILDETRWNQLANDLKGTLKGDSAFWLSLKQGIYARAKKPGWLWLELIPAEFLPWKQPPGAIFTEPTNTQLNKTCAVGWISGSDKGYWKSPCSLDVPIVTLCERRAFSSIPNFNKANAKVSSASMTKDFSTITLPNGKNVKIDLSEDQLKKANQKLNDFSQLLAKSFGIGDKFKPSDSPLRDDVLILPEDLDAEFNLIKDALGPPATPATIAQTAPSTTSPTTTPSTTAPTTTPTTTPSTTTPTTSPSTTTPTTTPSTTTPTTTPSTTTPTTSPSTTTPTTTPSTTTPTTTPSTTTPTTTPSTTTPTTTPSTTTPTTTPSTTTPTTTPSTTTPSTTTPSTTTTPTTPSTTAQTVATETTTSTAPTTPSTTVQTATTSTAQTTSSSPAAVSTTTTLAAPANPYGRQKRGNPVKNNNWGNQRNITYNYDQTFSNVSQAPHRKENFDKAVQFWQQNTCFDFAVSNDPDVVVILGDGCYSFVGKAKIKPPQPISLGGGCDTFAIASHELAHTLGLAHEHAKSDRDKYVDVFLANVIPNALNNFRTCCDCVEPEKYPYDYGSVMHYKMNDFSSGGPTILPKDKNYWNVIGTAFEPSFLDVKAVNDLNCNDICKNSATQCKNGGYPHPKNCTTCLCPPGFGGVDCSAFHDGKCGYEKTVGENPHEFASPDFPEPFGEANCTWLFKAPPGQVLQIEFSNIFFDMPMDCFYGHIEIRDGKDFTATGRRFCQNIAPPVITTESNSAVILLKSHLSNDEYRGFSATVQAIPANQAQTTVAPKINLPGVTGTSQLFDRLFDHVDLKLKKRAAPLGCATIAGSIQNAGPAGLTLRADNN